VGTYCPDVTVCDINMPQMNDYRFIHTVDVSRNGCRVDRKPITNQDGKGAGAEPGWLQK